MKRNHQDPNHVRYAARKQPPIWPLLIVLLFIALVMGVWIFGPPWPHEKLTSQGQQVLATATASQTGDGVRDGQRVITEAQDATARYNETASQPDPSPKPARKHHRVVVHHGFPASAFPPDRHRTEWSQLEEDRGIKDPAQPTP